MFPPCTSPSASAVDFQFSSIRAGTATRNAAKMPSTDMVNSNAPRQTLVEKKIEALGLPATKRLVSLLVSATIGAAAVYLNTASARAAPLYAAQVVVALLFLAVSPLFVHVSPDFSSPLQVGGLLLVAVCGVLPCCFYVLRNLLFGHVDLAEPQWYDAVWRIYGVLFLWMLIAVVNEAKIRPWFRQRAIRRHARFAAGDVQEEPRPPPNTVAARADAMRRKAREQKLLGLREAIIAAKRRRDAARKGVTGFDENVRKARENVVAAEEMVQKAKDECQRIGEGSDGWQQAVKDRSVVEKLLEGAVTHEDGLEAQTEAQKAILEDCEAKIKDLDEKWAYWSVLDNYPFYR